MAEKKPDPTKPHEGSAPFARGPAKLPPPAAKTLYVAYDEATGFLAARPGPVQVQYAGDLGDRHAFTGTCSAHSERGLLKIKLKPDEVAQLAKAPPPQVEQAPKREPAGAPTPTT